MSERPSADVGIAFLIVLLLVGYALYCLSAGRECDAVGGVLVVGVPRFECVAPR